MNALHPLHGRPGAALRVTVFCVLLVAASHSAVLAQSATFVGATPSPSALTDSNAPVSPVASPAEVPPGGAKSVTLEPKDRIAALDHLAALTKDLSQWALLILGGTIAALLTTSYRRPGSRVFRCIIAGVSGCAWLLLAGTVWFGLDASRSFVAMKLMSPTQDHYIQGLLAMNRALGRQLQLFGLSVVLLVIWLAFFVIWWVVQRDETSSSKEE